MRWRVLLAPIALLTAGATSAVAQTPPVTAPSRAAQPPVAAPSRADSMLARGRLRAAEDALYAAVAATPRDPAPRGALGRYLASRGRFTIAQVLYEEAQRFGATRRIVARAIAEMAPYRPDTAQRGRGGTVRFAFAEDGMMLGSFVAESAPAANAPAVAASAAGATGVPVPVTIDPRRTGFAVRDTAGVPRELRIGELRIPVRSPAIDSTIPAGELRVGVDLLWRYGFIFDERAGTLTLGGRASRSDRPVSYVPLMITFPGIAFVPSPGLAPIPMERAGARRWVRGTRWWLDPEQGALVVER
jgi:hypothetical protein